MALSQWPEAWFCDEVSPHRALWIDCGSATWAVEPVIPETGNMLSLGHYGKSLPTLTPSRKKMTLARQMPPS
jgi:hypothetical protein